LAVSYAKPSLMRLRDHRYMTRTYGALVHDMIMAAVAMFVALYLRVGDEIWGYSPAFFVISIGLFSAITGAVVLWQRLHKFIWSYTSLEDVLVILKVTTFTVLFYAPALFLLTRMEVFPRSSLIISWFVLAMLLGGTRLAYRIARNRNVKGFLADNHRRIPVLLVGAGDGTEVFIREMSRMENAPYHVVGIIDDKGSRVGRNIRGIEVAGTVENLPQILRDMKESMARPPQKLVVTRREIEGEVVRNLVNLADEFGVTVTRLPELTDFKMGKVKLDPRPIQIDDLLGRPQAVLDHSGMQELVAGKTVLITGAGGSIGSELCRQVAGFGPSHLIVLDHSEYLLYKIDMEVRGLAPDLKVTDLLADVRDTARIDQIFEQYTPDIVFHAAALKHVPMVEDSPIEGAATNILGTQNIADACVKNKVAQMVMISTDKAVNPTSIMGMTKRVAETYCQALDAQYNQALEAQKESATRFVTVRFGNVLGSTGSVVPLFQEQIAKGGPVTVTHEDVTRYFMSIREAVALVIQSAVLGAKGASSGAVQAGSLFVLDMGEPVKIVDLARQMIILAGLKPDADIKILFTGLRPGEKLFEELFYGSEEYQKTDADQIFLATPAFSDARQLAASLKKLRKACASQDETQTLQLIQTLVPERHDHDHRTEDRLQSVA